MAITDFLGEIAAIAGAVCFGIGNVIIKSQGGKIKPFAINALRLSLTAIIYIIVVASLGVFKESFTLGWKAALFFTGGTVIGVVIGDMIFYFSQQLIGLSRAYPIAASYPLLTYIVGMIFKYEVFAFLRMLGVLLVIVGVYLVTISTSNHKKSELEEKQEDLEKIAEQQIPEKEGQNQITESSNSSEEIDSEDTQIEELNIITTDTKIAKKNLILGLFGAVGTAVCWTIGTTMMDQAFNFYESPIPGAFASIPANTFRIVCVMPIALLIFAPTNRGKYKNEFTWKGILLISLAGIIGNTAGSFLYILALQFSTASTTAAITAAAPLIATPLSIIFLKEKISWKLVIGTLLSVTGIWCIIIL